MRFWVQYSYIGLFVASVVTFFAGLLVFVVESQVSEASPITKSQISPCRDQKHADGYGLAIAQDTD